MDQYVHKYIIPNPSSPGPCPCSFITLYFARLLQIQLPLALQGPCKILADALYLAHMYVGLMHKSCTDFLALFVHLVQ